MGIGQEIALRLAEAGAAVAIADSNVEAAEQTAEMIGAQGGTALAVRADASSHRDAELVMHGAKARFGRLDILVNNAGIFPMCPALDVSPELWQRVIGVNLSGAFFYAQAAAQVMVADGHGGRILTLRTGYSPTGSRFVPAGIPASPRRRCPRHWIFRAAFSSRSSMRPQCIQTWVRTLKDFSTRSPQPEQSCDVDAGSTASTRLPAHAALRARMMRKWPQPASRMLLLSPALRLAPLCS
jgi:hypothetical protein